MNELKHVKHPEHCLAQSEHVSVSLMERNERRGNTQKEQGICHTGGRGGFLLESDILVGSQQK